MLVIGVVVDHHSIVTPIYASFDRSLSRAVLAIAAQIHRQPGGQFDIMNHGHQVTVALSRPAQNARRRDRAAPPAHGLDASAADAASKLSRA